MKIYSPRELCTEAERELAQRRRVYARLVEQGKMKQAQADDQIARMKQIREEYNERATAEETRSRLL